VREVQPRAAGTDEADPEQVARLILLRRLTSAPRTRAQLRDDLRARAVPDEVAERVLDRFVEVGLIDDEQFARMWVESRHRSRGSSRSLLRRELQSKGVDAALAQQAVEQVDPQDERERARELVRTRAPTVARLEPQVRARRLVGMLQRRGYSAGLAYAVVREVLADEELEGLEAPVD